MSSNIDKYEWDNFFLVPYKMKFNPTVSYPGGWAVFKIIDLTKSPTKAAWFCGFIEIVALPTELLPVVDPPPLEHALRIDEIIPTGKFSLSTRFCLISF